MTDGHLLLDRLSVSFGNARILESVSVEVAPGEIVGYVGPNGAGKTTTLRAISGVVRRDGGEARLSGQVLPADPAAVARLGIAHVPEGRGLIPNLSVRDNLRLGVAALGKRFRADHWDNAVAVFPAIGPLADRKAGYLSGGEQQMVAIARGLAAEPRILMIDELSLGLAPKIVVELLRTLSDVARRSRLGILLVDQNVRALAAVCGRLYTLQDGRSAPASLDDDSVLRSAYFGSGAKS